MCFVYQYGHVWYKQEGEEDSLSHKIGPLGSVVFISMERNGMPFLLLINFNVFFR